MAEVNYMASTSRSNELSEPSVEIIDPKDKKLIDSNEENLQSNPTEIEHPNRPSGALWKQQKLPAWQPILTTDTVLPAFFLLGVALIPIGVGLLISSNLVQEISFDYTDCYQWNDESKKCSTIIRDSIEKKFKIPSKCECRQNFTLTEDFEAPVFFYYGLSSFYQNHRRYVQSRDDKQLAGSDKKRTANDLEVLCEPFKSYKNGSEERPIAPCGVIANSFFNDTFKLFMIINGKEEPIDLLQTDIAWPTDKEYKYKNPPNMDFSYSAKPLSWQKYVNDLDPNHPNNNGYQNEHLIVWMRTAALPTFKKLWGKVNHDQNILWRQSLPKGQYVLKIDYNFPVIWDKYRGSKHFYFSNTSWLGGKNTFLGYAYIVVGAICLLLWLVFLIMIRKFGQKPKDIVDIGPKTRYHYTGSKGNAKPTVNQSQQQNANSSTEDVENANVESSIR